MKNTDLIPLDQIQTRILQLRGYRVLLDSDLAVFYGVPTYRFNEAVTRKKNRFPADLRFQLTYEEVARLKSQFAMSKVGRGGRRTLPWAFTEHGALMAANVLNSPCSVQMSLVVIRAFVALRRMVLDHKALAAKLAELDARVGAHDEQLAAIIEAIRQLAAPTGPGQGRKIGFHQAIDSKKTAGHSNRRVLAGGRSGKGKPARECCGRRAAVA